jgi:predicted glycosyltransferase involved in capsule biosynthesis
MHFLPVFYFNKVTKTLFKQLFSSFTNSNATGVCRALVMNQGQS